MHLDPETAAPPVEAVRIARLDAENPRLAEENVFLRRAAAFFAEEQR